MSDFSSRREVIKFCGLLYSRGYLCAGDGNVSIRLDRGYLTTPSGRNKGLIQEHDLVHVDLNGNSVQKGQKPSSEFKMHLEVYRNREDVNAVVHCHPTYASVFACTDMQLDEALLTESAVLMGAVPKSRAALPSTEDVPQSISPFIKETDTILLGHHGALCFGANLEEAFNRMETLEHVAKVHYLAELSGRKIVLPKDFVNSLELLRDNYGLKNPILGMKGE
jgi:L-fuculose-phosphate aldolase